MGSDKILVSVVIPCYNVENYIEECLDSVYDQEYEFLEVIAVDNNSTDYTLEKLQQYKNDKQKGLIILLETKQGAPAARNTGLKHAKGDWIQFLDADDLLKANKIQHQINLIKNASKKDIVFVVAATIKIDISQVEKKISPSVDYLKGIFSSNYGNTCANLWNRKFLTEIKAWNEELKSSQEYDLMFRLLQVNNNVLIDNIPLTVIRERKQGQISHRNPKEKWNQYIELRLSILDYIENKYPNRFEIEKNWFYQSLVENLVTLAKYDYSSTIDIHGKKIPKNFKVKPSEGISKSYSIIYNYFGPKIANYLIYTKNKWNPKQSQL